MSHDYEAFDRNTTGPVAATEIPSDSPELQRSPNYFQVKDHIDQAIATSEADKLPRYMITARLKASHLHGDDVVEVSLAKYLGGNYMKRLVTDKEYFELSAKYSPLEIQYHQQYLSDHPEFVEQAESSTQIETKVGHVAIGDGIDVNVSDYGPPVIPDGKRRAAGE